MLPRTHHAKFLPTTGRRSRLPAPTCRPPSTTCVLSDRLRARSRPEQTPNHRVDGFENTDAPHAETEGREKDWEHAPAHAVVEDVDQARLRAGEEVAVLEGGYGENLTEAQGVGLG